MSNTGGQSGTTTLTETVPDNTSYSGSSEGWTVASGNYTQDVTVAAGATGTAKFTVTVGTLGDGVLSIANTVASGTGACSSCTVTNATDPRLSISKSVPSSLPVGGTGSYTITLTNKGGSATSGVVTFTDTLPTGLSFNAQTAGAPELACTAAGQVVTCTGSPDIAVAGTESVTYSVDVAGSASGTLINGVLLTALGGDPRTPANDAVDPSAGNATQGSDKLSAKSAQSVTSGASLATTKSLTKVNGATPPTNYLVSSGDVLEYTVSVSNTGGQSGTTTLTETVPDNTSYSGSSEGWTVASGNYTQDVTVAAGATVTKTFTVTVGTLGDGVLSIANTVASGTGACSSCTVTNATDPRLSISKSVPSSLPVGGTGSYTITLTNKGGSATSGVVTFTDTLPTGLSFNAQTAGAPELACTAAGQVVTCTGSPDIAVAGTESVTYSVDVAGSASGTLINGVLLTALGGDPRTPANDAVDPSAGNATQGSDKLSAKSAQSVTSGASLATTKSLTKVNGATPPTNYLVSSGDVLEYTVSVANTGGQSGTTTLTETVPDNTSYSGSSEGWTVASGNYTQDVTVAAGATGTVRSR